MMEKIESGFDLKLKPGETLLTSDKFNEYVDMLDDFTNREIVQMARLSRKEGKMPFEQLYLLFKYGEKDNPWEKLQALNSRQNTQTQGLCRFKALGAAYRSVV